MKLPKGWIWTEIAQLAEINTRSLSASTPAEYRFRYVDISCVSTGHIDWPTVYTTFSESPSRARRLVAKGDVLMSMVRPNLQSFALVTDNANDAVVSTGFAVLSPKKNCDGAFLFHSLFSGKLKAQVTRLLAGSGYPALNSSEVEDLVIAAPEDIAEQRKIGDILTTWDEALEKLAALIAAKERRKKDLMQQILTGGKRFPAFSKSPWKQLCMGELLTRVFRPIRWAGDRQLSLVSLRRRCGGLFRRPDALGAEYKTHDLHELKSDDFLISKRQVAHGAWALVPPSFEGSHVSKEYAIFVNASPDKLHMPFFAWLAQTPRMIRLARVASTGVHIEKLIFDPKVFLRESIRIPIAVTEQKIIAATLDAAQSELHLLRAQRDALDQQKRGLMQKLLTGKVRVKP